MLTTPSVTNAKIESGHVTHTTSAEGVEDLSSRFGEPINVPRGTFVFASAPARIDLAGGWTDTMPITHEHGGKVVNVAVKVNNEAPNTVKARRTEALILSLSDNPSEPPKHYHSVEQIRDHADPLVPCTLLKACIVASGILGITPRCHDELPFKTLAEVLKHSGGGLELVVQSSLPLGSGMGTSSILSATILAVLKTLKGEAFTMDDILYQTLDVEQMMNTGGGWQDQVGGILPGFKVTTCRVGLPIQINTKSIDLSSEFINSFNSRLLLIFTGQTRLAKNLLQTVLMNWAGQEPAVVETMDRLVKDATECENVLTKGDWAGVGTVLSRYFTDKRFLSNTTLNDPSVIARLLTHLGPYIEGASLAGAGGGGFLAALLKPSFTREDVVSKVRVAMANDKGGSAEDEESMWAWQATVDTQGLVIGIGS
ncbi:ribosomal protein S5 domain 2-type protein [Mortierella sp. GBAus27b]|nr:ribosomal protein S5 domain 2-type protein [Mortierella sp. GBAus27b]